MHNIKNIEPDPCTVVIVNFIPQHHVWNQLDFDVECYGEEIIQGAARAVDLNLQSTLELSVMLASDAKLKELNAYFRNIDKPTNVLSFPYEDLDEHYLGDVAISYETIHKEAKEQEKQFQHHFAHMLLHGFLHLLGYDHIDDNEKNEMETLEISILKNFNILNPYI